MEINEWIPPDNFTILTESQIARVPSWPFVKERARFTQHHTTPHFTQSVCYIRSPCLCFCFTIGSYGQPPNQLVINVEYLDRPLQTGSLRSSSYGEMSGRVTPGLVGCQPSRLPPGSPPWPVIDGQSGGSGHLVVGEWSVSGQRAPLLQPRHTPSPITPTYPDTPTLHPPVSLD